MTQKTSKTKRKTRAEREAERRALQDYWQGEGRRQGKQEAEKAFAADQKVQWAKANIELARQLGQMIEATARAVITFCGEGIRG